MFAVAYIQRQESCRADASSEDEVARPYLCRSLEEALWIQAIGDTSEVTGSSGRRRHAGRTRSSMLPKRPRKTEFYRPFFRSCLEMLDGWL